MSKTPSTIPPSLISTLSTQILSDPLLPRPHPTESFWQLPAHPLSATQSPTLPQITDYAIIGSGITGTSIASTLLSHPSFPSTANITVLEARTLCSGATGRNGGALTTFAGYDFLSLCKHHGREEAVKIGMFAHRTLEKMHELGNSSEELKKEGEVRRLRGIIAFRNQEAFQHAKESFALYEACVPEAGANVEVLSAEEALARYNVKDTVGALVHSCGAFWPYRLVTTVWSDLVSRYPSNLHIETSTPVTEITYTPSSSHSHPYTLSTPRGPLKARVILHATNGHASHLLPRLRGAIYPFRGTMSVHSPPPGFGRHGSQLAWSFSSPPSFDASTGVLEAGLYYSNQNPVTGDVFIGGEKVQLAEMLGSDDSEVSEISRQNLSAILPRLFARGFADIGEEEKGREVNGPKESEGNGSRVGVEVGVKKIWSGIMGWTADHLPLVGRVPAHLSGRGRANQEQGHVASITKQTVISSPSKLLQATSEVKGEFIAAGFNGYGMPQCWSAGEAVARLALGEREEDIVGEFLPRSYLLSEERFGVRKTESVVGESQVGESKEGGEGKMGVEQALRRLMGG